MKRSHKKGFSIIELVIVMAIATTITTYSVFQYIKAKEMNMLKMEETIVSTTINNANISSKRSTPRYVKFYNEGILIAKEVEKIDAGIIYLREEDTGTNSRVLKQRGLTALFECDSKNNLNSCPMIIIEDDTEITSSEFSNSDNSEEIKKELSNATTRKNNRYIKFENGNAEKNFTVYIFDKKGIVRQKIEFTKGNVKGAFLDIKRYVYQDYEKSPILRDEMFAKKNDNTNWQEIKKSQNGLRLELK